MNQAVRLTAAVAALAAAVPVAAQSSAQPWYQDVTTAAGIQAPLLQDKPAGGIGVGDFDRDGWPDLFLTGYFEPNRLYFNDRTGGFVERPDASATIALPGSRCTGVAVADYDNDGWPDIYLVCNGDNRLLRNLAGTGFADVTPPELNHPERSEGAVWADFNEDGVLDLVIAAHPRALPYDPNDPTNYDRILLSQPGGGWVDIAPNLAIEVPLAATLGLAAADIDLDGRMDLYFANDRHDGNTLLLNRGPGCGGWCFEDVSMITGADRAAYSMGIAISDYDRDGDIDLYYSSMDEQILLVNDAGGPGLPEYCEDQQNQGVNSPAIGWGVIFLDADNDGLDDLFLGIGGPSGSNQDQLFHQQSTGGFAALGPGSGLHHLLPTEAAARVDYDRDGRVDLVLGHSNLEYRLYRNVTTTDHGWIGIELVGSPPVNRDAIGSRVEVVTVDGRTRLGERRAGESRGASHDYALHFGLGSHHRADVTVRWPDGRSSHYPALAAGRYHRLYHPNGDPLFSDSFEPGER
ncbi:MAG: hypothetical protein CVV18_03295 [Gammaproteobacteria bacterium HGW-Gammaproteobacteria-8]|nr:MAG: hypothetical protein CVV18_03295 [Gammaproteobacteria bacterium HGW-Gammaproteobacteria-8]